MQEKKEHNKKKITKIKKNKKNLVANYNNRSYVNIYDQRYHDLQFAKISLVIESFQKKFSGIQGKVLDVGCGTGLFYDFIHQNIRFREYFNQTVQQYVGIDFSSHMLQKFLTKQQNLAGATKLHYHLICADGENLPLRAQNFEQIVAFTSLQNLIDLAQGLREIFRVIVPDGIFGFTFLKKTLSIPQFKELLGEIIRIKELKELVFLPPETQTEDWIALLQTR